MSDAMPKERWLPVVGYEGWYEVSDQGRVRSLDRWSTDRWTDASGVAKRFFRGRMLRPAWSGKYYVVGTHRLGVRDQQFVHVLVAEAFLGPRPLGAEVCHGPNGPMDNRAASLRWGTRSDNSHDRRRDGTNHHLNKSRCRLGHLYEPPNLVPAALKRGKRDCLACGRARAWLRRHHTQDSPPAVELLQELADRYYEAIMENFAA